MDFGGRYQHKSSPSDRFLGVFSPPDYASSIVGDELNEDDVFWTGDFAVNSDTRRKKKSSDDTASFSDRMFAKRSPFQEERFGILTALGDGTSKGQQMRRKSLMSPLSAAKNVVGIPKVKSVDKEMAASPKFNYSAPVNVPVMTKEMMKANAGRNMAFYDVVDDESDDDEMLPPHEIVARGSGVTPNTTFSMLEGAGRTLKGRDLRRVRNAVFRQTGFLD